ncbi:DUF2971 domain-containing protein [Xanthobacter sp. V4C-4]|uniref:DUF2971 domain-containing protein n=1 Tax=Xanthobacter cornucopiae TaxID=3119924 RepID=UPI00372BB853
MAKANKTPARLYKYRAFSNLTLEMLVDDTLYFADPSSFNDPLDTRPTLDADVGAAELESMLLRLVQQRAEAEMSAAAKTIRYRGPKTIEHISRHSQREAAQLIERIRYYATNPEYEIDDPEQYLLGHYVESELLQRYDKGVLSLAERAHCPLMWSHYGDQHRGLCIGYSVPDDARPDLHKISYGGNRLVAASAVGRMLNGDATARAQVDGAVLLRKAAEWRYEKEWRLIGPRGLHDSQLELEEIVFGMRCTSAVKYAVIKALEARHRPVQFYEIREQVGQFTLAKRALNIDELAASYPCRARSFREAFSDLEDLPRGSA